MTLHDLTGQTINQYELRELLGEGGMGAVYRAWQKNLEREVAVKILPSTLATQADYMQRFQREARTAASLEHANIVPVHDYGTADVGGLRLNYVVMRLLKGGSLADRLRYSREMGKPLPTLQELAAIVRQLANALDYAHGRGVIHRDIKPSNVMFDTQGTAFLVDFGIAKLQNATSALTGTGVALGTPSYMAPEQWLGKETTPAADQYALGVVIYELLSGHLPFEADSPFALGRMHIDDTPTPLTKYRASLPPAVEQVINRALTKDPAQRYPSVRDLALAFEAAAKEKVQAETTGFFVTPLPPRPAKPLVVTPPEKPTVTPTPPLPDVHTITTATNKPTRPVSQRNWLMIGGLLVMIVGIIGIALLFRGTIDQMLAQTQTMQAVVGVPSETPTEATAESTPEATTTPGVTRTLRPTNTSAATSAEPVIIASAADEPTATSTPSYTATDEPTATRTPSDTPSPTDEPTVTPTHTSEPSKTPSATATPTVTNTPTFTPTLTTTPSDTPSPTAVPTDEPTATNTRRPTSTPTRTPRPTATNTLRPTNTPRPTATNTPRPTETPTPTQAVTLRPSATPTTAPVSASVIVTSASANVRSGPGTDYAVVGTVSQGTELSVVASVLNDELWYLVLYTNDYHWISASVVSLNPPSAAQELLQQNVRDFFTTPIILTNSSSFTLSVFYNLATHESASLVLYVTPVETCMPPLGFGKVIAIPDPNGTRSYLATIPQGTGFATYTVSNVYNSGTLLRFTLAMQLPQTDLFAPVSYLSARGTQYVCQRVP